MDDITKVIQKRFTDKGSQRPNCIQVRLFPHFASGIRDDEKLFVVGHLENMHVRPLLLRGVSMSMDGQDFKVACCRRMQG